MKKYLAPVRRTHKLVIVSQAVVLVAALMFPLFLMSQVEAAQLTARKLTISSAVPSQTNVTYTYAFTTPTNAAIQSIEYEACTTAVGSCSAPAGVNINQGAEASRSGWTNATAFTRSAGGGGGCTPGNGVLCLTRSSAPTETPGARTLGWDTQTNPSSTNTAFFIRITLYSDAAWATPTDTGTVAAATVQTLTINANVAEVLNFCIGNTTVNDATSDVTGASADDCTGVSGTSIHLGNLDTSVVNVSPVSTSPGDGRNAVAVVRTNAGSGVTVHLHAILQSGTDHRGTLRVSGADCENEPANTTVDQCINAQGTTQSTFTNGAEKFGMTIAAINCAFVGNYTCNFAGGTYNLTRDAAFDGDGGNTYPTDTGGVAGTTDAGYAWDESGVADLIASSVTVVDDEALILKFAATPSITTPFGVYAAQADFVATPTY